MCATAHRCRPVGLPYTYIGIHGQKGIKCVPGPCSCTVGLVGQLLVRPCRKKRGAKHGGTREQKKLIILFTDTLCAEHGCISKICFAEIALTLGGCLVKAKGDKCQLPMPVLQCRLGRHLDCVLCPVKIKQRGFREEEISCIPGRTWAGPCGRMPGVGSVWAASSSAFHEFIPYSVFRLGKVGRWELSSVVNFALVISQSSFVMHH